MKKVRKGIALLSVIAFALAALGPATIGTAQAQPRVDSVKMLRSNSTNAVTEVNPQQTGWPGPPLVWKPTLGEAFVPAQVTPCYFWSGDSLAASIPYNVSKGETLKYAYSNEMNTNVDQITWTDNPSSTSSISLTRNVYLAVQKTVPSTDPADMPTFEYIAFMFMPVALTQVTVAVAGAELTKAPSSYTCQYGAKVTLTATPTFKAGADTVTITDYNGRRIEYSWTGAGDTSTTGDVFTVSTTGEQDRSNEYSCTAKVSATTYPDPDGAPHSEVTLEIKQPGLESVVEDYVINQGATGSLTLNWTQADKPAAVAGLSLEITGPTGQDQAAGAPVVTKKPSLSVIGTAGTLTAATVQIDATSAKAGDYKYTAVLSIDGTDSSLQTVEFIITVVGVAPSLSFATPSVMPQNYVAGQKAQLEASSNIDCTWEWSWGYDPSPSATLAISYPTASADSSESPQATKSTATLTSGSNSPLAVARGDIIVTGTVGDLSQSATNSYPLNFYALPSVQPSEANQKIPLENGVASLVFTPNIIHWQNAALENVPVQSWAAANGVAFSDIECTAYKDTTSESAVEIITDLDKLVKKPSNVMTQPFEFYAVGEYTFQLTLASDSSDKPRVGFAGINSGTLKTTIKVNVSLAPVELTAEKSTDPPKAVGEGKAAADQFVYTTTITSPTAQEIKQYGLKDPEFRWTVSVGNGEPAVIGKVSPIAEQVDLPSAIDSQAGTSQACSSTLTLKANWLNQQTGTIDIQCVPYGDQESYKTCEPVDFELEVVPKPTINITEPSGTGESGTAPFEGQITYQADYTGKDALTATSFKWQSCLVNTPQNGTATAPEQDSAWTDVSTGSDGFKLSTDSKTLSYRVPSAAIGKTLFVRCQPLGGTNGTDELTVWSAPSAPMSLRAKVLTLTLAEGSAQTSSVFAGEKGTYTFTIMPEQTGIAYIEASGVDGLGSDDDVYYWYQQLKEGNQLIGVDNTKPIPGVSILATQANHSELSVNQGTFTGTETIEVSYPDTSPSAAWATLTLRSAYSIEFEPVEGSTFTASAGSPSATVQAAPAGETVTINARRDDGYKVSSVQVSYEDANGKTQTVQVDGNENGPWTFTMPAAPVTITAEVGAASGYVLKGTFNGQSGTSGNWTVGTTKPVLVVTAVGTDGRPDNTVTYRWSSGSQVFEQTGSTLDLSLVPSEIFGRSGTVTVVCSPQGSGPFRPSTLAFTVAVNMPTGNSIAVGAAKPNQTWIDGTNYPQLEVTSMTADQSPAILNYSWFQNGKELLSAAGAPFNQSVLDLSTVPNIQNILQVPSTAEFECRVTSPIQQPLLPATGAQPVQTAVIQYSVTAKRPDPGQIALAAKVQTINWLVGTPMPQLEVTATSSSGAQIKNLICEWSSMVDGEETVIEGQAGMTLPFDGLSDPTYWLGTRPATKTFTCTVQGTNSYVPSDRIVFTVNVQTMTAADGTLVLGSNSTDVNWVLGTTRPTLAVYAFDKAGNLVTEDLHYDWTYDDHTILEEDSSALNLEALTEGAELLGTETAPKKFKCTVTSENPLLNIPDNVIEFTINVMRPSPTTIALSTPQAAQTWTLGMPAPTLSVVAVTYPAQGPVRYVTNSQTYEWALGNTVIEGQTGPELNLQVLANELRREPGTTKRITCTAHNEYGYTYAPESGVVAFAVTVVSPNAGTVTLMAANPKTSWFVGTTKPVLTVTTTGFSGDDVQAGLNFEWQTGGQMIEGQTGPILNLATVADSSEMLGKDGPRYFTCRVSSNTVNLVPANGLIVFEVDATPLPQGMIAVAANNPLLTWPLGSVRPTLSVTATNYKDETVTDELTYKWYAGQVPNGRVIPDQTGSSLNLQTLADVDTILGTEPGTKYFYCVADATNTGASLAEDGTVQFTVNIEPSAAQPGADKPTITLTNNTQVRVNTPVTVTATLTGWFAPQIQWTALGCGNPAATDEVYENGIAKATFTPTQTGRLQIMVNVVESGVSLRGYTSIDVTEGGPVDPTQTSTSTNTTAPTDWPTGGPSGSPSGSPSSSPSGSPSASPSGSPTASPSGGPSATASGSPGTDSPIRPNPSTAPDVTVTEIPGVVGDVVVGLPISTRDDLHSVGMLGTYLTVPSGCTMEVFTAQDVRITDSFETPLSTGQIIRVFDRDGAVIARATVIVKGDVLGRGEINIAQLVRLAQACTGARPLTGVYEAAGDFTTPSNNRIDIADVVREADLIVKSRAN